MRRTAPHAGSRTAARGVLLATVVSAAALGFGTPAGAPPVPAPTAVVQPASGCAPGETPLPAHPGGCVHGVDGPAPGFLDGPRVPLRCDGGTSGDRVQFLYAHVAGRPDLLRAVGPQLRAVIASANGVFVRSAATLHRARALRVVTRRCQPVIVDLALPAGALRSFNATVAALIARGFTRPDRKYLVFTDVRVMCGVGEVQDDDQPGPGNVNNAGPTYARVDASPGCWNGLVVAHEITHMLGAVQHSAPHHTPRYHCTDGHDRMCYADGSTRGYRTVRCPRVYETLLDCGHDDYFNPAPARGSYLARHWDTAASAFLYGGGPARPPLPGPVGGLTGVASGPTAVLGWSAATGQVGGYRVYRANTVVATSPASARGYTDPAPGEGDVENLYQVAAFNAAGEGARSLVIVFVPAVPATPEQPTAWAGVDGVHVAWTPPAQATWYQVARDGGVVTTVSGSTSFTDTGTHAGEVHSYAVRAGNSTGVSGWSEPVMVTAIGP